MLTGEASSGRRTDLALGAAFALVAVAAFLPLAAGAFFLFDDYAVVGVTSTTSLRVLAGTNYGFFRPAALALFRGEALAFGWAAPWAWAAVSAVLHLGNAFLAAAVYRRAGLAPGAAAAGAALFAASPWSSEALFWTSAQPDLLAVSGFLLACVAGLAAMNGSSSSAASAFAFSALAALAAAVAVFSKEMAVTLPLLFLILAASSAPAGPRRLFRAALPLAGMAAVVALYLVVRARVVPGLAGPYGAFTEIARPDTILPSLLGHLRELVLPPVFPATPSATASRALLAALFAIAIVRAFVADRRRAVLLLAGLVISFAPVIWNVPPSASTAGGRLRYLPGFFFCAVLGLGAAGETANATGRSRIWTRAAAPAAFVFALLALASQRRLWTRAASIARHAIGEVAALAPISGPLHVANLPFAFDEGPYILKSYAFRHFLSARLVGKVRSTAVTYAERDGGLVAVREEPDPFSDYVSDPGERTLVLRPPAP